MENANILLCFLNAFGTTKFNSSPPSAAYMRQWTGSSLVQVMACRLFGAKPLPEPMLTYCQLDSWEHISVKFESEFYHFHSRKCNWKCRLPKCRPFCSGGDELTNNVKKWNQNQGESAQIPPPWTTGDYRIGLALASVVGIQKSETASNQTCNLGKSSKPANAFKMLNYKHVCFRKPRIIKYSLVAQSSINL